jgi:hypothetical protein
VSPALFATSNNITSVTVGGSANTVSLTFDSNGVITGASNNALSVANSAIQAGAVENYMNAAGLGFGMRNRIINGGMVIDQRNAGASVTPTASGTYNLDRWKTVLTQASKFSIQQNAGAVTPPVGFINYAGITSLSAYSVTSSDIFSFAQAVEGLNVTDLGWGTANAKTVTISFWVRSSLTGTFSVTVSNASQARSYPATFTISSANTWEQKSITVAGDTSGTWLTTNGIGVWLFFNLGSGSTFSATANAWGAGEIYAATGATSVVGTSGATFYITGVQLEKGSTATSFDFRAYSTEFAMCQRYLPAYSAPGGVEGSLCSGSAATTTISANYFVFPVSVRVPPTGITSPAASKFQSLFAASAQNGTAIAFSGRATTLSAQVNLTVASGLTVGQGCQLAWNTTSTSSDVLYFTGCEL